MWLSIGGEGGCCNPSSSPPTLEISGVPWQGHSPRKGQPAGCWHQGASHHHSNNLTLTKEREVVHVWHETLSKEEKENQESGSCPMMCFWQVQHGCNHACKIKRREKSLLWKKYLLFSPLLIKGLYCSSFQTCRAVALRKELIDTIPGDGK